MSSNVDTPWSRDAEGKTGLSRGAIVATAIRIADEEGLKAVSIRRIATELGARPMSLYSYIDKKHDLIDLMIDEVVQGHLLEEVPSDWREALRQIAEATREVARAHPWMIVAAFERPRLGPNTLRHIDQSLAAVSGLPLPFDRKRAALLAIDTYTLGFARWEASPRGRVKTGECTPAAAGMPTNEDLDAYLAEQVATGEYPHLAAVAEADLTIGVKGVSFETGLEWLLAGIAAEVEAAGG
jgi:AcrR family transcriptional regulator